MATTTKSELAEIKRILAHIVGSTDLPKQQQFSKTVLDKAAKLFKEIANKEEPWVKGYELSQYFESSGDGLGKFIREEFEFSNYYKEGTSIYYNKNEVISLAEELKLLWYLRIFSRTI